MSVEHERGIESFLNKEHLQEMWVISLNETSLSSSHPMWSAMMETRLSVETRNSNYWFPKGRHSPPLIKWNE